MKLGTTLQVNFRRSRKVNDWVGLIFIEGDGAQGQVLGDDIAQRRVYLAFERYHRGYFGEVLASKRHAF